MKLTPEDVRRLQELRRSGAAGTHKSKAEKRRSKRTEIERAVREDEG